MIEKILNFLKKLIPKRLFKIFQPYYHFLLIVTGNLFYRFPGRKLKVIGVTGTNGKSTTVELINAMLKETGYKTGMISTVAIEVAGERKDNITNRTTLGRWQTPHLLRQIVKAKCDYAVIEVASEGIAWFRIWGIPFDVAVFTNLSPEHLNFHGNMTNYRNVKGKLFLNLSFSKRKKGTPKVSVVNADDREAGYFGAFPADKKYTFGLKKGDLVAKNIKSGNFLEFNVAYGTKIYPVKSPLFAQFNVLNILAAFCVGLSQEIDPKIITKGIEAVKLVPGRMQKVVEANGVSYFLDYAVTPDAFELLFQELRKLAQGKIIAVFGATGDRDKEKRPKLGETAAKLCDVVIVTDEEAYSEDPAAIIEAVALGAEKVAKNKVIKILDRKKALKKAIELAESGDVVVATGLGHQKYRNIGGNKKIAWDEAEIIKDLLK